MSRYAFETRKLAVGYDGTPLIQDIEIAIEPGQVMTLIGPNGAGKSTILKSISKQLQIVGGTVLVEGRDLAGISASELAKTVSMLFSTAPRTELLTCQDIVETGRYPYTGHMGVLSAEDHERVDQIMKTTQVWQIRDRDFSRISDGQRQRVMLARAICQEPKVLVLDEPTSFLDIRYKLELLQILKKLARERQVAVILSLHELDLAQKAADQIVCVRDGAIDRCGTPEEIFSGGYIQQLYGVERAQFNENYGSLELQAASGGPEIFVIGGGGDGIAVYRRLQRRGIPFAAGVLHENDLDYPVAAALAARVVTERAFEPIGEAAFAEAAAVMADCRRVICCCGHFGTMNQRNAALRDLAAQRGVLTEGDGTDGL